MTCAGLGERPLDGAVDVKAGHFRIGNGLVTGVHHGKVFDMFESFDRDSRLYPGGSPVGEIVPAFGILVDGVLGGRIDRFYDLPRPCPGEIGEIALLLHVLVAVDCIERLENRVFLHD